MNLIFSRNSIIKFLMLLGSLLFLQISHAYAQNDEEEEEQCELSTDKKALKLYEKGIDRKHYSFQERSNYLRDAVKEDPDFTVATWKYAQMKIKDALLRGKTYANMEDELLQVIDDCPNIHSAPYFFLAEIYMQQGKFESAADYYERFLDFSDDDDAKFDRKYDEQLETAKQNKEICKFLAYQYANPHPFNPVKTKPLSTDDADEYLPFLSPDNRFMYFTRRFKMEEDNKNTFVKSDRIFYIERFSVAAFSNGTFEKGGALSEPFNLEESYNYGGATLTQDNKEMFFTICEPVEGKMNCDIFYTQYVFESVGPDNDDEVENWDYQPYWHWTEPERMGPEINTEEGWESQPTISKDGQWLMFASLREGSRGIDIYESRRDSSGEFQKAENIGEPINTAENDKSPFFHSDSRTLYFSSQGNLGMGGYDVFFSKLQDDGTWSDPVNLGYPINSDFDEHGYVVSLDGKKAYFGSASPYGDKKKGTFDIYSFDLPKEMRPDEVLLIKGEVSTVTGLVPKDAVLELRNTKTLELETVRVDNTTGAYTAILNMKDTASYMMTVKGTDVGFNNQLITAPEKEEVVERIIDVKITKAKQGAHITIDNVHFKTNSADLSDKSRASLDALVAYLKENPNVRISIEGHTDDVGDDSRNLSLSADRAFTVMTYIQNSGINSQRLKFKGWGETRPVSSNKVPEGRALNRRIEVVILEK